MTKLGLTRLLVTGGRGFNNQNFADAMLNAFDREHPVTTLIEGGASGADAIARTWAALKCIPTITVHADWNNPMYGNNAGRVRNCKMLRDFDPDYVMAFPGGGGTRHMVNIALEAGVTVYDLRGTVHYFLKHGEDPTRWLPKN